MVKRDILAIPKGDVVKLADGKEYMLAPFSLTILAELEEAFDCDMEDIGEKITERSATGFRKMLWILLRENYPDISLADAGKLVLLNQILPIVEKLTAGIEGLKV